VTNLWRRLENVLIELDIIRRALEESARYPSCCLLTEEGGKIGCEVTGPLPEKEFLEVCQRCRARIRETLARMNLEKVEKENKGEVFKKLIGEGRVEVYNAGERTIILLIPKDEQTYINMKDELDARKDTEIVLVKNKDKISYSFSI
jgi:hypothetical protein